MKCESCPLDAAFEVLIDDVLIRHLCNRHAEELVAAVYGKRARPDVKDGRGPIRYPIFRRIAPPPLA